MKKGIPVITRWLSVLSVIIIAFAVTASASAPVAAQQTGNQLPFEVSVSLSHIYNAVKYGFLNNYSLTVAAQDEDRSLIYMGGTGFTAALNPYDGSVSWSYSLTGTATAMALSGSPGRWVAVGTDQGELLAIDTLNLSNMKYFQGVRGAVTDVDVASDASGYVLGAVDDQGFLYLYRIGSPYWFEMGPAPDTSVYRSLANYTVSSLDVLVNRTSGTGLAKNSSILLVYAKPEVDGELRIPVVYGSLYYLNDTTLLPASVDPLGLAGSNVTGVNILATYIIYIHSNETGGESYYSGIIPLNGTTYDVYYKFNLFPGRYSISIYLSYAYQNETSNTTTYYNYSLDNIQITVKPNQPQLLSDSTTPLTATTAPPPTLSNANSDPKLTVPRGTYYTQVMVVNASRVPNIDVAADIRVIWVPLPLEGGATGTVGFPESLEVLAFVSPVSTPPSWSDPAVMPWGPATSILVLGGPGFVSFYYLNSTGGNATWFYQYSFVDGTPLSVDVSPDARMIAVGTSGGLAYLFVWNDTEARYTAAWTYALGDQVGRVRFLANGTYLLLGGQHGVLQLMNVSVEPPVWQPLWRGGPGFNGIVSGVDNLNALLARDTMDYIVVVPDDGSYLIAMKQLNPANPRLYPLLVYSTNYYHFANGTVASELALGRNFTLFEAGQPVAFSSVTNITSNITAALFYVPVGTYNVKTIYPGYGEAYAAATVTGAGVTTLNLDLHLTQHMITTVIPEPSDPTDGTSLVAGPLPEVQLSLQASSAPQGLIPYDLSAVTDLQGEALVWVWSNVSYTVVASKEYYLQSTIVSLPASPTSINLTVEMQPVLTDVYLNILDSDLYSIGLNYPVDTATVVISANGRNLTVEANQYGVVHVRLPGGTYSMTVYAPYYYADVETITIPFSNSPSPIYKTVLLAPVYYTVNIQAVYDPDSTGGFIGGGVPGVSVTAVHLGIAIPPVTAVTGPDGYAQLSLRAGNYTLTFSGSNIETATLQLQVVDDTAVQVQLAAKQSNFTLTVLDVNYNLPVPGVEVRLSYIGGNSMLFTLDNGTLKLTLPYGNYTVQISHPRYSQLSTTITVDRPFMATSAQLYPTYAYLQLSPKSQETLVNVTASSPVSFPSIPLSGFQVTITPWDDFLEYLGIGSYTLYSPGQTISANLYIGVYNITITRDGYSPVSFTVNLTTSTALEPILEPLLYSLNITFTDDTLALPGGVVPISAQLPLTLTIISWNGVPLGATITTSSETAFTLPPGYYVFNASLAGYQPLSFQVELDGDASYTASVEPILVPATLNLVAIDSSTGQQLGPITDGNITLVYDTLPLSVNATAEVTPAGVSTSLRPGTYTVYYMYYGMVLQSQFQLTYTPPGGPIQVLVEFNVPRIDVLFTVSDAESTLYDVNATVKLHYLGPFGSFDDTVFAVSSRQGAVSLRLIPGIYSVSASAEYYVNTTVERLYLLSNGVSVNLEMEPVKYYVSFDVKTPEGDTVTRGRLTIVNLDSGETVTVPVLDGTAQVADGLRAGRYSVSVVPEAYYLKETTASLVIPDNITSSTVVSLTVGYKMFNVTIELRDSQTGNLIGLTYMVKYERLGDLECANCSGTVNVTGKGSIIVPYGTYKITFTPLTMDVYQFPEEATFDADANKTVTITADPIIYTVTVTVTNDLGETLGGALVTIVDANGIIRFGGLTTQDGTIEAQLTYGVYQIVVEANGYEQAQQTITVPDQTNVPLTLQPTLATKLKRMTPIFIGVAGLVIFAMAFYRISKKIMGRMEEEYF